MRLIADIGSNWRIDGNDYSGTLEASIQNIYLAIDELEELQVHFVKFQLWDTDEFIEVTSNSYDIMQKYQMPYSFVPLIMDYCHDKKILPMFTPFDLKSLQVLCDNNVQYYKISSSDFTYDKLIKAIVECNPKELFISCGNTKESEIINFFDNYYEFNELTVLHCNVEYPTKIKNLGFSRLEFLRDIFPSIGFSSHVKPHTAHKVMGLAYALGARTFEFHYSSKVLNSPDKEVSLDQTDVIRVIEYLNYMNDIMSPPEEINPYRRNLNGKRD